MTQKHRKNVWVCIVLAPLFLFSSNYEPISNINIASLEPLQSVSGGRFLRFSNNDPNKLFSASFNDITLWNIANSVVSMTFRVVPSLNENEIVEAVTLSQDDSSIIFAIVNTSTFDAKFNRLDLNTLKISAIFQTNLSVGMGMYRPIRALEFRSADALLARNQARTIELRRLNENGNIEYLYVDDPNYVGEVYDIIFSPVDNIIAGAWGNSFEFETSDSNIRLWNLETRNQIVELRGHTNTILNIAYSNDGQLLASISSDETIRIWSTNSFATLCIFNQTQWSNFTDLAFSLDASLLISSAVGGVLTFWDVSACEKIAERSFSDSQIMDIEFNSDGTRLALATVDDIVEIWGIPKLNS